MIDSKRAYQGLVVLVACFGGALMGALVGGAVARWIIAVRVAPGVDAHLLRNGEFLLTLFGGIAVGWIAGWWIGLAVAARVLRGRWFGRRG